MRLRSKLLLGLPLLAVGMMAAQPADAWWRGGFGYRGCCFAGPFVGGLVAGAVVGGLAAGAAAPYYYAPPPVVYAPPPPPPPAYYAPGGYYAYPAY